jgi:hypothetical protein
MKQLSASQYTYHLEKDSRNAEAGVGSLSLFDVPLFLRSAHAFELEVARMGLWSDPFTLKEDEDSSSNNLGVVSKVAQSSLAS